MSIQNRAVNFFYKLALTLLCGWGILLNSGITQNGFAGLAMFKYYTIQSNALVFVFYLVASIFCLAAWRRQGAKGPFGFAPHFKGAVVMAITVTMLIYQFLLAETPFSMGTGGGGLGGDIVHLYVPLLVILDWILFDLKGVYRPVDPVLWLVIPLVYLVYALVAAALGVTYHGGSRYPYFFIDADLLGAGRVALNVVVLAAGFLLLGYIIFGLDKLMARAGKSRRA